MNLFANISVYGKKKTGKTVFVNWLLRHMQPFYPWLYVFTKTKHNLTYSRRVPNKFIFPGYSNEILELIVNRQQKASQLFFEDNNINPRIIVIWDDCLGHELLWNQYLNNYYYISRHLLGANIMTAQHVQATPPSIRTNTDYGVLFNTDYGNSVEELWRNFACKMPKDLFAQILQTKCTDYGFLVVDNDPNLTYAEKFYVGKAEIIEEEFVMGCEEFWRGSEKQLREVLSGDLKRKMDLISELNDQKSKLTYKMLKDIDLVDPKDPSIQMGLF